MKCKQFLFYLVVVDLMNLVISIIGLESSKSLIPLWLLLKSYKNYLIISNGPCSNNADNGVLSDESCW